MRLTLALLALAAIIPAAALGQARAQPAPRAISETFVSPARGLSAVLRRPVDGPAPHIGIVYENGSSLGSPLCAEMARRGFATLCSEERRGGGAWESVALDVRADVEYLRRQAGVSKVVLYGHSGGGAVASFYQAVAENGVGFCQAPSKLSACPQALASLPPADAVVFPDAHPGLAVMELRMINPSVSSDGRKLSIDPALDPFNPANGFNPSGPSHYPPAFQARYTAAQAAAMRGVVARAQALNSAMKAGAVNDLTTDQIVVSYSNNFANHLDELDPAAIGLMATRAPRRLLRNDGSITVQPIRSVSVGNPEEVRGERAAMPNVGASSMVLSRSAVRADDSVSRVDWCSANSVTVCNTRAIRAPVLFIAMGANTFIADEERMFEGSPSADKEYIVVEGALHGGQPCTKCETTPGQYSNSQRNMYDYIAGWINKRF